MLDTEDGDRNLHRSVSQLSVASVKSQRSQRCTLRNTSKARRYASHMSSSASSIASSDKSLTSFPSFSPESPRDERPLPPRMSRANSATTRKTSGPASIVESLTTTSPSMKRAALFDEPVNLMDVPGALHNQTDEHIERIITRTGPIVLVRQLAKDLAERDAQYALLKCKAANKERALRKIILECGLSNLELETRLRAIEDAQRAQDGTGMDGASDAGALNGMLSDAMSEPVVLGDQDLNAIEHDATIRASEASEALRAIQDGKQGNVMKGWKDYLWGGTGRKTSRSGIVVEDAPKVSKVRNGSAAPGRRTVLENDLFQPPEAIERSASRNSSVQSSALRRERKPASGLAGMLKMVAGSTVSLRDENRGRTISTSTASNEETRTTSPASVKTSRSTMTSPKAVLTPRRLTKMSGVTPALRGVQQERWDTMGANPQNIHIDGNMDNSGPVEMDTILPPDAQPPAVTQTYNDPFNPEFLTDRYGFIYDQRRKKRQKEAAERIQRNKRGSRIEMLNSPRNGISPVSTDLTFDDAQSLDIRPDTPVSLDDENGKTTKRWQDYLKIATSTFAGELLSHTPSTIPAFEVMEGGETPRTPAITTEERGFMPLPSTTLSSPAISVVAEDVLFSKPVPTESPISPLGAEPQEDTEPVRILLKQLGEVHDSLQREKTIRWNDFLRKVRAERKRDGEAAAAAHAADTRTQRPLAIMPEAVLQDGELIGVAGLGNKGKVGRAKWNEFKSLVLGGIPIVLRAKVWAECSGASALRIPGYYEDLVSQLEGIEDLKAANQIKMDINRTLTDNIFFRRGTGVCKLEEVLVAYSRRNTEIGYCQGMNLITACLLLIMPTAEDAFWMLASIIEKILPNNYYDNSLLASRADQQVLQQYVAEILPKLSTHLHDLSIELEALSFQWFLSVFTDCLSAEALFRVWDVLFCTNDGSTFLFQVALALLKLNEQQLLQCSTTASIYTYLNHQMTNHAISIDGLIQASEGLRKVVKREEVESRRNKVIEAEKDLIRQREERKAENIEARAKKLAAATNELLTEPLTRLSTRVSSVSSRSRIKGEDKGQAFGELAVKSPLPIEAELELGAS
ncbi:rab-GTPase-TBC domain-containing protein [Calycina marina]|uniref:Rab-GTPase-TBC domain-containing protein n=1 Tax=Calycina marina TaxID=1763456 RepID=A0A9P7YZZ6_9HELO|nr:rab-GTPase-TBC domain-containing protein [Calycina marina]